MGPMMSDKIKMKLKLFVTIVLSGSIYTKRQPQRCEMLAILFSLKTTVSLENGLQLHSEATPLFSM